MFKNLYYTYLILIAVSSGHILFAQGSQFSVVANLGISHISVTTSCLKAEDSQRVFISPTIGVNMETSVDKRTNFGMSLLWKQFNGLERNQQTPIYELTPEG